LALIIEPKQQQQKKQHQEKTFYVLKRISLGERYEAVALYDSENHYRGLAIFESLGNAIPKVI
jgi:hypothetical protein